MESMELGRVIAGKFVLREVLGAGARASAFMSPSRVSLRSAASSANAPSMRAARPSGKGDASCTSLCARVI